MMLSSFRTTTVYFPMQNDISSRLTPSCADDHTDVTTLKHVYSAQTKGTVHFFAPLGNKSWFESLGFASEHVTELDWCGNALTHLPLDMNTNSPRQPLYRWESRGLQVTVPSPSGPVESHLRVSATPCQHFTGRGIHDVRAAALIE